MDYSGRFVDAGLAIQAGKGMEFGDGNKVACPPVSSGIDLTRVVFKQVYSYIRPHQGCVM